MPRPALTRRTRATWLVLGLALVVLCWALLRAGTGSGSVAAAGPGTGVATTTSAAGQQAPPRSTATPDSGLPVVAESALPAAARRTLDLIRAGGPFPYSQDGAVFSNRERVLPQQARGYYHEYTVKQGSAGDRGPLRIVGGRAGDLYWTSDHYAHFSQIAEGR